MTFFLVAGICTATELMEGAGASGFADCIGWVLRPVELAYQALWEIKSVNLDYDNAGKERKLNLYEFEELRDEAYECAAAYKAKIKQFMMRNFG